MILTVFIMFVALYSAASHMEAFNIGEISVRGAMSAPVEDIVGASGLAEGMNGLAAISRNPLGIPLLRVFDAEAKLKKAYPFIKKVSVVYLPSGKVNIKITEKQPAYTVRVSDAEYLMDETGTLLGPASSRPDIDPPELSGLETGAVDHGKAGEGDARPGDNISRGNENRFIALKALKRMLTQVSEVEQYDLSALITGYNVADLFAVGFTVKGILRVNVGDTSNLDYKLRFFVSSYKQSLEGLSGTFTVNPDFTGNYKP